MITSKTKTNKINTFSTAIISDFTYNSIIAFTLSWGFLMNYLILTNVPVEAINAINPIILIFSYFGLAMFGQHLYLTSSNPVISFIGYNLVVVPVGIIITPYLSAQSMTLVVDSFLLSMVIACIMMIGGILAPKFFQKIAGIACFALIGLIVAQLFSVFVMGASLGNFYQFGIIAVMSIFIAFYWSLAMEKERTVDNAIDSAADLYLPIINIMTSIIGINKD